jgi:uncharacterized protein (DUF2141 family)
MRLNLCTVLFGGILLATVPFPIAAMENKTEPAAINPTTTVQTPGFKISGKVIFSRSGDIYLAVVTAEQWNKNLKSDYFKIIPVETSPGKSGEAAFEFDGVLPGAYGITAFQDLNSNGKLDMLFGPTEPTGTYRNARPMFRPPSFDEMEFQLDKDLTEIVIELK